jgi:hypothetical protein
MECLVYSKMTHPDSSLKGEVLETSTIGTKGTETTGGPASGNHIFVWFYYQYCTLAPTPKSVHPLFLFSRKEPSGYREGMVQSKHGNVIL